MPSKLEQLKTMTTVVSDSGDFSNLSEFGVTDSTTNPSLILKAAKLAATITFSRKPSSGVAATA